MSVGRNEAKTRLKSVCMDTHTDYTSHRWAGQSVYIPGIVHPLLIGPSGDLTVIFNKSLEASRSSWLMKGPAQLVP